MYEIRIPWVTMAGEENIILKTLKEKGEVSAVNDVFPAVLQEFGGLPYTECYISEVQTHIEKLVSEAIRYSDRPIICVPQLKAGEAREMNRGCVIIEDYVYKFAE